MGKEGVPEVTWEDLDKTGCFGSQESFQFSPLEPEDDLIFPPEDSEEGS